MTVGTRRSDIDIIRDILAAGLGTAAELRDAVNLSHTQLHKYLDFLEQANLIALHQDSSRGVRFSVTDKGELVLQLVERLKAALTPEAWTEAQVEPVQSRRA